MKPIKKIFVFKDSKYKIVKGKRNYLEYEVRYLTSNTYIRKRIYKGLAECNTMEELYLRALDIVKLLSVKATNTETSILQNYLLENKYHYAPKTFSEYQGICRRFEKWCIQNKIKPEKIEYKNARDYLNYYAQGKKSGSAFTVLVCLKAVYNGLKREGKISHNHWAELP